MIWSQFRRPTFWWLAGLLAIAAFVRFRGIRFGLPHTQARPDETAIIDPVRVLLSGHLPHFYDYPWLFLWIVALGYVGYFLWGLAIGTFTSMTAMLASWPVRWSPFFLIPRVISAAAGTLSVLVVFRLGRQIRDDATAIVAALFFAFSFMHVRSSHFGTTDVMMTGLIVAAVSLLIDAHRTRRRGTFFAAGLVAGLAAATKYNAVILVVPMIASQLLHVWERPACRREAWRDPGILYFSIPFVLAFAIGVPFILLDRAPFLDAMRELGHALRVGDVRMDLGNGWLYHLTFSLRYDLGVPLLVTGLAGAGLLLWAEPPSAILLLSFPVAYYVVAGSIRLLFVRYAMPITPFLCVTAAYFVCRLAGWVATRISSRAESAILSSSLTAVLALVLVWPSAARVWAFDRVLTATDNRVVVAQWFFDHVPPGQTVLQSGSRYGLVQFWDRRIPFKEWRWDGVRQVFILDGSKRFSTSERPDWIILQDSPLPSSTQAVVNDVLAHGYVRAAEFPAFEASADLVYDQQDAFYVPLSGFEHVARPGPNFSVFKHEVVALAGDSRAIGQ
jgi:4-amino-4-deoxy-L-arabinose transferase-like glycosyltransferase